MSCLMDNNKNGILTMGMKYVLRGMLTLLLTAQMAFVGAAETITYYHNDALGSPVAATDEADGPKLSFRLDLSPSGPKLKPLELLGALLEGLVEDIRSIPMRRTLLLTRNPHPHRPLLSPMEQLAAAERQLRSRARWCA